MAKVVRHDIDNMNATIQITIGKDDYMDLYKRELGKFKNREIKGFRKGKTPMNFLKKVYGGPVLEKIVLDKVNAELHNFLTTEKINYFGNPIQSEGHEPVKINPFGSDDYEFSFDLGIIEEFSVKGVDKRKKHTLYKIEVSDELVQEEMQNALKRGGEQVDLTEGNIEDNDIFEVTAKEIDGEVEAKFSLFYKDLAAEMQSTFLGKAIGEMLTVNVFELEANGTEHSVKKHLLQLEDESQEVNTDFELTIESIKRSVEAEMNEEFFQKSFGPNVKTEEEATTELRRILESSFDKRAASLKNVEIEQYLIEKNDIEVPQEFLKRWLLSNNDKATMEEIEKDFPQFLVGVKWSVVRQKLMKDLEVKVTEEMVVNSVKQHFKDAYGLTDENEDLLNMLMQQSFQNEEAMQREVNRVETDALFDALNEKLNIVETPISFDDFKKAEEKAVEKQKAAAGK